MAKRHTVHVLTRAQNRRRIEPVLARNPVKGLTVVYCDIPGMPRQWDGESDFAQIHYPLWQLALLNRAKRYHQHHNFDIAHHVSWGRYWGASRISSLEIPFVWGPVGGGESTPKEFMQSLGAQGILYERIRNTIRSIGERDPFVRTTAKHSSVALATTTETAMRLHALGAQTVELFGHAALSDAEIEQLADLPRPSGNPLRFVSMGRLLHWKGFHYALQAFARSGRRDIEYWIIGDGAERKRLQNLSYELGVSSQVRFFGSLPRTEALNKLSCCHALLHPSLHDSGGWVCIEAMAAGRPVLCLDCGGPATLVDEMTGIKISVHTPSQVIDELSHHIRRLSGTPDELTRLGEAAKKSVRNSFTWERKVDRLEQIYRRILSQSTKPT